MILRIEQTSEGSEDFCCPHCFQLLRAEWNTEYGDAQVGDEKADCPKCSKEFTLETRIEYSTHK